MKWGTTTITVPLSILATRTGTTLDRVHAVPPDVSEAATRHDEAATELEALVSPLPSVKWDCGGHAHATVPNSAPTPAVSAMASAPQNVTRIAPIVTPAPPARAANPPRRARNASEVPETRGIKAATGAMAVTKKGRRKILDRGVGLVGHHEDDEEASSIPSGTLWGL
jgi:hypothetical protein